MRYFRASERRKKHGKDVAWCCCISRKGVKETIEGTLLSVSIHVCRFVTNVRHLQVYRDTSRESSRHNMPNEKTIEDPKEILKNRDAFPDERMTDHCISCVNRSKIGGRKIRWLQALNLHVLLPFPSRVSMSNLLYGFRLMHSYSSLESIADKVCALIPPWIQLTSWQPWRTCLSSLNISSHSKREFDDRRRVNDENRKGEKVLLSFSRKRSKKWRRDDRKGRKGRKSEHI